MIFSRFMILCMTARCSKRKLKMGRLYLSFIAPIWRSLDFAISREAVLKPLPIVLLLTVTSSAFGAEKIPATDQITADICKPACLKGGSTTDLSAEEASLYRRCFLGNQCQGASGGNPVAEGPFDKKNYRATIPPVGNPFDLFKRPFDDGERQS